MRGKIVKALICLVLIGVIGTAIQFYPDKPETLGQNQLRRFFSYEQLEAFVKSRAQASSYYEGWALRRLILATRGAVMLEAGGGVAPDYSVTNIQVEGVDEADIIKTDGKYIYLVSRGRVIIVKAYPPEEARVLSEIELGEGVKGLFINGDKLVIFEEEAPDADRLPQTSIKVYDVSNRESPLLKREVSVDGQYFGSRMIGDYSYAVMGEPAYEHEDKVSLPKIYFGDRVKEIPASDIYYSDVPDYSYAFTTIIAINVKKDDQEPAYETILLGASSNMYVSLDNIYLAFPVWGDTAKDFEKADIHRIHIEDGEINYKACGEVPGMVLNQFSMDEYKGYFRVATTTGNLARSLGEAASQNHLYILNMGLNIIGSLEGLAPGEDIHSARFMGDRCYLVTFRKIDPFFVIDLQNPSEPKVLGELKITGYSDYLHPYDDNHIIGIGKETVAAQDGDFAWYQGVKISLFDVSKVEEPEETAKYEIGGRGSDSPVLRDHKALLFDKSKNLLVIPVLVTEENPPISPDTQGRYVWQGVYIFNISLDEGLKLKGKITHYEDGTDLEQKGYDFSHYRFVERSLYIGNVLYTISEAKFKINSLENLDYINEVEL